MKHVFISTIVGDDQPDIINSLADKTRSLGGEWIKSKVSRLDGRFAAIMKVSVDQAQESTLKEGLEKAFSDLTFSYAEPRTQEAADIKMLNLVMDCDDRPGLTKDITRVLFDLNLRPENLEVSRLPIFQMGQTVYSVKMSVGVPETLTREQLSSALTKVSDSCRINFD